MDLWVFIIILVAIGSIVKLAEPVIKKKTSVTSDEMKSQQKMLLERLQKQDERIANLETLFLEFQKEKKFDDLK